MKTLTPSYGATMTEHPDGQYVALADYQALVKQQQIDRNNSLHTVAQLAKMSAERDALVFELNALRLSTNESLELAEFKAAAVSAERDALAAKCHNVIGVLMQMRDRWWPFVHGAVSASEVARGLLKKSADVIETPPTQCLRYRDAETINKAAKHLVFAIDNSGKAVDALHQYAERVKAGEV